MKKHWTSKYIYNRIKNYIYFFSNKNVPWLSKECNKFLNVKLNKEMVCLEFGSGNSSLWIANRVKYLTSIEHNFEWFKKIDNNSKQIKNFKILYLEGNKYRDYSDSNIDDNSIDFCLVDGLYRDEISLKILNKLKPGGIIIIDDVQRYLPSNNTLSPAKNLGYTENWGQFKEITQKWQRIYFSDGVSDQLAIIKPI